MINATVFGTGNMGSAIGDLLTAAGFSVQHVDEDEEAFVAAMSSCLPFHTARWPKS